MRDVVFSRFKDKHQLFRVRNPMNNMSFLRKSLVCIRVVEAWSSVNSSLHKSRRRLAVLMESQSGSCAVEYVLLLSLICVVISGTVQSLGSASMGTLSNIARALKESPEFAPRLKTPPSPVTVATSKIP